MSTGCLRLIPPDFRHVPQAEVAGVMVQPFAQPGCPRQRISGRKQPAHQPVSLVPGQHHVLRILPTSGAKAKPKNGGVRTSRTQEPLGEAEAGLSRETYRLLTRHVECGVS